MPEDPNWPRASHWLAQGSDLPARGSPTDLAIAGLPFNQSITPGRCDLAPAAIRQALQRFSTYDVDLQVDLRGLAVKDYGDVEKLPPLQATAVVLLGGDNNVTRIGVQSVGIPLAECGLLTFDAHHDVRDMTGGFHNGNPIRALLDLGLPGTNIVQIGIQPFANSQSYSELASRSGITVVTADQVYARGIEPVVSEALARLANRARFIYIDLDVDVLDRAFAPACPGSRPGGLQPWMLRNAARLCGRHPKVKVIDIVEVDPTQDIADVTCLAAASFLLAFAAGVATRKMA